MNNINTCNNTPVATYGFWDEQLWAAVNRNTGAILGFTNGNVDTNSIDSWPLDPESQLFLDVIKEYCPKHIPTMEDIDWFCERYQWRLGNGWGLMKQMA
jgi:hypothetical protein